MLRRRSLVVGSAVAAAALLPWAAPASADPPTLPQFEPYGACTARVIDWSPLQASVTLQGVAGCPTQWWVLQGLACLDTGCYNPALGPDWGETPYLRNEWPIFSITGAERKTVTFTRMRCTEARFIQMDLVAMFGGPTQPLTSIDSPSEHNGPLGMGGGDTPSDRSLPECQEISTQQTSTTTTAPTTTTTAAAGPTTTSTAAAPTTVTTAPLIEVAGVAQTPRPAVRAATLPATGAASRGGADAAAGAGLL
ncbi:MAG: hypothetical protein ACKVWR_03895, partial [Acidimicrobiales bacterium]